LAGRFIRRAVAQLGLYVLALLMAVALAALEPQLLQCKLFITNEPSSVMPIIDGPTTGVCRKSAEGPLMRLAKSA